MMAFLLGNGIALNAQDEQGETALLRVRGLVD